MQTREIGRGRRIKGGVWSDGRGLHLSLKGSITSDLHVPGQARKQAGWVRAAPDQRA